MDIETLIFTCANCSRLATACPECVVTIAIDPRTGLPPDVGIINGKAVHLSVVNAEARQRSRQQPLCDHCVTNAIAQGKTDLMTAEERHRHFHV